MRGKVRPSGRGISDENGAQQHPPKQTRRSRYSGTQTRLNSNTKPGSAATALPPSGTHDSTQRDPHFPRLDSVGSRLRSASQFQAPPSEQASSSHLRRAAFATSAAPSCPIADTLGGSPAAAKEKLQSARPVLKRKFHEASQTIPNASSSKKSRRTSAPEKSSKFRQPREEQEPSVRPSQARGRFRKVTMSDEEADAGRRGNAARASESADLEAAENDAGLQSLLRKLGSGLEDFFPFAGMGASRAKSILQKLRSANEDYEKVDALSELCEMLSVGGMGILSTLSVDSYVPTLVGLLSPPNSPDTMLLAARALSHMMEVLPGASSSIASMGAAEPLCASLLAIEYIDLAEQSLTALEKLSVDYPGPIIRAGGFAAALTFVDFFATPVQRVAAQLACNLCRNCPVDKYDCVQPVLPILLNLLNSEDQRIRESAMISMARLGESFKHNPDKIEALNGSDGVLLQQMSAIVQMPYPSNWSSSAFSSALSLLGIMARGSSRLCVLILRDENLLRALASLLDREKAHCWDSLRVIDSLLPDAPLPEEACAGVRTRRKSSEFTANPSPSDEKRREALVNEPKLLEFLGAVTFGGLIDFYVGSEVPVQRDTVLNALQKYVALATPEAIRPLLRLGSSSRREGDMVAAQLDFVPFLASLLGGNGSLVGRVRCLNICSALLGKVSDDVRLSFQREGMIQEIKRLQARVDTFEEDKNNDSVATIKRKARALYAAHFEGNTEEVTASFRAAGEIASTLRAADSASASEPLSQLAALLCSAESMSTYELFESGLVSSLHAYLGSSSSSVEQVNRLLVLFGVLSRTEFDGAFGVLLRRLLTGLATEEQFMVVSSSGSSSSASVFEYGLRKLTQPLKLNLRRCASDDQRSPPLRDFSSSVVLIEPLATMGSIQEFLWPRVRSFRAPEEDKNIGRPASSNAQGQARKVSAPVQAGKPRSNASQGAEFGRRGEAQVDELESLQLPAGGASEGVDRDENQGNSDSGDGLGSDTSDELLREGVIVEEPEGDSGEGEMDTDDGTPLGSSALGTSLPAVELNLERAMGSAQAAASAQDDSPSGEQAENVTPSSSTGKPSYMAALKNQAESAPKKAEARVKNSEKLVFRIGGVRAPLDHTILQAVAQRKLRANASEVISFRLWDTTHTVEYERAEDREEPASSKDTPMVVNDEDAGECKAPERESAANERWVDLPGGTHVELPSAESPAYVSEKLAELLVVLRQLHWLNRHYALLAPSVERSAEAVEPTFVSSSAFQSQKLSAKMTRQISDPLILCGGLIPSWCFDLSKDFPFLLPFEVRLALFQSYSLGLAQALSRLQARSSTLARNSDLSDRARQNGEAQIGRIQRQKVRIHRDQLLESGIRMMELYASHRTVLEVEYFNEAGTGLGPTVEFYSNVCLELQKRKHTLWRSEANAAVGNETGDESSGSLVVPTGSGLFPACLPPASNVKKRARVLQLFKFLGQFCGKALLDGRLLDLRFSTEFSSMILSCSRSVMDSSVERNGSSILSSSGARDAEIEKVQVPEPELGETGLHILQHVDPVLAHSLAQILEMKTAPASLDAVGLVFTLPGDDEIELVKNGRNIAVTAANVEAYVRAVSHFVLYDGIKHQALAFVKGFNGVLSATALLSFTAEELEVLLCGPEYEKWDPTFLIKATICDHGYNHSSQVIGFLFRFLSELSSEEERAFLRFITGTPRLPIGGLAALQPRLTIVKRTLDHGGKVDDCLPTVMTCSNYLKLPDYSCFEVLRERFLYAMCEGQGSFHLS